MNTQEKLDLVRGSLTHIGFPQIFDEAVDDISHGSLDILKIPTEVLDKSIEMAANKYPDADDSVTSCLFMPTVDFGITTQDFIDHSTPQELYYRSGCFINDANIMAVNGEYINNAIQSNLYYYGYPTDSPEEYEMIIMQLYILFMGGLYFPESARDLTASNVEEFEEYISQSENQKLISWWNSLKEPTLYALSKMNDKEWSMMDVINYFAEVGIKEKIVNGMKFIATTTTPGACYAKNEWVVENVNGVMQFLYEDGIDTGLTFVTSNVAKIYYN